MNPQEGKHTMSDTTAEGIQVQIAVANWTGAPTTLNVPSDSVNMPQTANGSMIVTAINKTTGNSAGTITISSGGSGTTPPDLPPQATAPWAEVQNFMANNLQITNISTATATPILVQAIGPGIPGVTPKTLSIGVSLPLAFGEVAQGGTNPQRMILRIQNTTSTQSVVGVIGGPNDPSGNNGKVIALNAPQNTGPGGPTPPAGYYATTINNSYNLDFNWNGAGIFVGNLSSSNAASLTLTLMAV